MFGGTSAAQAQRYVTGWELGAYGVYTKYDPSSLGYADKIGVGGRLAYFLTKTFSIEASGDYTETEQTPTTIDPITITRLGGTLYAHRNFIGSNRIYLGAGYEQLFYRSTEVFNDNGVHVAFGDRVPLGSRAFLRLEGRAAYFPSSPRKAAGDEVVNFSASAGLSIIVFGGTAPGDSDRDGINDRGDQCAATPVGAAVDPTGCPFDTDDDTIYDGLDSCPRTPLGARVDGSGCPADDDSDAVYNGIDLCPDTPTLAEVDQNGCPSDSDSDTIFDGLDLCPDTPQGATADEFGCTTDEDRDGVFDGIDQCPSTPFGTAVDNTGCPPDRDGDGVLNQTDRCPDTPSGAPVDATGCQPAADADSDGVTDTLDRCPGTAPNRRVDAGGCPILFVVEQGAVQPLVLTGVSFASGSSRLTPGSSVILNDVSASLLAYPEIRIEITGHTDNSGRLATNQRLSLARAQAVRGYLAQRGVPIERMEARGFGPDQPMATNLTAAGRARNRRVELRRIAR